MLQKNWKSLIQPNKQIQVSESNANLAVLITEPLERGFGMTLGNALRRVLMSSLQGAAITSIQIEGVLHEFSSIPGVREDVTDIILNIKALAIRMHSEGPRKIRLRAEGPGVVTAKQIEVSADIEIMNPDLVICTLDNAAHLAMELTVETGRGYIPASALRKEDTPIGLLPVDALFSPIRKVAYKVENSRVGQVTDYDRLSLTVETDGSVTPEDAIAIAARILQDQRSSSSTLKNRRLRWRKKRSAICPSTAICCVRSMSWSCRCVPPTASRTTTSSISAIWFKRAKAKCSARRILAARA